jgi:prepilin-type N-terminal cleavage/methylation domain-containing protein
MRRTPTQPRGFTLIELIVAMGMVAILSVSLYASLRIAFRAKESAEKTGEVSRTAELAMGFIRDDLQNAMQPAGPGTTTTVSSGTTIGNVSTAPPFAGSFVGTDGVDGRGRDADDLVFYSTANAPLHASGNSDIKMIELAVVQPQGSNDYVLVRRVTPNLLALVPPNPDEEVVCRGVGGFNLRYFNGSAWLTSWNSTDSDLDNTLPVAVEVTLQLDRADANGQMQTHRFVRVFQLPCSTAEFDTNVNPNAPSSGS